MDQVLHLLVVDAARRAALAARFGSRWLLPVVTCGERVRADRHALRWACARGIDADVAGQWLGRVGRGAADWLVVLVPTGTGRGADPELAWTSFDALTPEAALLDYQGWALAQSMEHGALPRVAGPFGNLTWIPAVQEWIKRSAGARCGCFVPYRTGAHEVVLGAHSGSGPIYFKGLSAARAAEARLTGLLARLEPSRFARTVALEEREDGTVWWLTAGCPGRPALDGAPVARALAQVQSGVTSADEVARALPVLDIGTAFAWAETLVGAVDCGGVLASTLAEVNDPVVPRSWIPMDLDPVNVLVTASGEVRFIDLDDSFAGPAPLAMALFARRSRDRSHYGTYQESWLPALAGVNWPGFERAVAVLDAWLGWRRVERCTSRGELHGGLALAECAIRDRLARALHGR